MSGDGDPKFLYNFGVVKNPKIPFMQDTDTLHYGDQLFFRGSVPSDCKWFEINLMGRVPGKGVETAFHFKPRWDHKTVVRNSRQDGRWGKEEVTGGTGNLSQNSSFEICFLVLKDRFSVAVMKKHFCDFKFRMPLYAVYAVQVAGDVVLNSFHIQPGFDRLKLLPKSTFIPPTPIIPTEKQSIPKEIPPKEKVAAEDLPICFGYRLETPFFGHIPGGLSPGKVIFLTVIPSNGCHRWTVNFWTDPHSNINRPFHFDVRHHLKQIIMNSTSPGGRWQEELPTPHMPVRPGRHTDVVIVCEKDQFVVSLYNNHFAFFKHRYTKLERINVLSVEGDCFLVHIRVQ